RAHRSVQLAARRQRCVLSDNQRLFFAVPDDRQLRLSRIEQTTFEHDRLPVSLRRAGLQADLLELRLDVIEGRRKAGGADVAALERVVGKKLNVCPPRFALSSEAGGLRGDAGRGG